MNKRFMLMMFALSFVGLSAQEADVEVAKNEQADVADHKNDDAQDVATVEVAN